MATGERDSEIYPSLCTLGTVSVITAAVVVPGVASTRSRALSHQSDEPNHGGRRWLTIYR